MAKLRKQTYTMDMYLNKMKDMDIRNDADVQRQFVWSNEQINELIVTVLTDDYIPPIILGEEDNSQMWIVDGGQRSAALKKYRYGNYKITSAVEHSGIVYKEKVRDEQGNVVTDGQGNIVWKDAVFHIKNQTYDKLPEELKKKFNEYQIETVIHEHCNAHRISQYIKRYNNHAPMNTNQKAFTYIDNFARCIREILDSRFFLDCSNYTEKEKTKGVVERVIVETVMCTDHLENWKGQTKAICTYLNQHAAKEEFEKLAANIHRLEQVVTEDIRDLFNSKDSFILLTLFDRFTEMGMEDERFAAFLREFKSRLRYTAVDGVIFDEADKDKGTKDKSVVMAKLEILKTLMNRFLQPGLRETNDKETKQAICSARDIVAKYIDAEVTEDDMELFELIANDVSEVIEDIDTAVLTEPNRPSFVALTGYGVREDIDDLLPDWLSDYVSRKLVCITDQEQNYLHMKEDLDRFVGRRAVRSQHKKVCS